MIDPPAPAPVGNMGQPIPRYDARAKVTGRALYAADIALPDVAYAYSLSSRIAKGQIKSFDLTAARDLPGVLDILPIKRSAAISAKLNTRLRAVLLRIPWFHLAPPRSPMRAKRLRWCLPKPWRSPKTRPIKLVSNTKSSPRPGRSIRRGPLNRRSPSRTRNTTIPGSVISRRL